MKHAPHRAAAKQASTSVDELKLALWYIGKCKSLDSAQRAFNAAVAATKSLQEPLSEALPG